MYMTINHHEYWVEASGDQNQGVPIVFLHGFTGSSQTWESTINRLRAEHHCITMDLPGHGKTKLSSPIRMEAFCDDLAVLFEQLQIKQAHLVGYSMGGRAALSFAILYPERVYALTLESASPGLDSLDEQLARQTKDEALAEQIEAKGVDWFVSYWENLSLFSSQQMLPTHKRKRIKDERLAHYPEGLASSLRGMGTGVQPSWWDKLATITIPVLLIVGELDSKFVAIAEQMVSRLQYASMQMVVNAGHTVHVEQPEKFDTIVEDFITRMEELSWL